MALDTSQFATTGVITAITAVPEPGSAALFGAGGLFGIANWLARRRKPVGRASS
ncbi:PEP-CTERM sorting domain-containing protein [Pelomonas sp. KK5]|uniref:PEP-CTERM sorting domain-containing protein n=1 Tax=Pelomonas sp. KK5 TaxID=1855730 RepID=UPI0009FAA87E|nr:PEP-CTERM sorting domain-containing protein [Pelomonas sp. KK5]